MNIFKRLFGKTDKQESIAEKKVPKPKPATWPTQSKQKDFEKQEPPAQKEIKQSIVEQPNVQIGAEPYKIKELAEKLKSEKKTESITKKKHKAFTPTHKKTKRKEYNTIRTKPWRTFSIFISSTFADMQAERDHLRAIVFPRVEEKLRKRRIKLEIVDLRWGVDTTSITSEDEREANVLKVCLEEIKRCRPFFIGLLGDRYGWVPPEERMNNAILGEGLESSMKGKSVTALEIEFGVLASKEQLLRSVFYFREPLPYETFNPEKAAMYSDLYNPALSETEKMARETALKNLRTSIREHFEKKKLPHKAKNYKAEWDKTEEEVTGLEVWGEMVYKDIIEECQNHAADNWDQVPQNWQEQEQALLDAFVEMHTSRFCGRKDLLTVIRGHLLAPGSENWGMVLTGESGSGKSAVFSTVYKMMRQENCFILAHSAGLSPRAKNVLDLLQLWNSQLSDYLGIEEPSTEQDQEIPEIPGMEMEGMRQKETKLEIEKIQDRFRELLLTAAEKGQVVLLVDALDRFEPTERACYMTWLPTVVPGKVRLLITAITGTEKKAVEYHKGLYSKSIDEFTQEEARETLAMLCEQEHKSLPESVEKTILGKTREDGLYATSSPLWLSLAVHMLMALDQDDFEKMRELEGRGDEQIESYMKNLADDFPAQPGELFLNLVDKASSIFGRDFTLMVFNYIACSRNGLRESDLEAMVAAEEDTWDALRFANLRRWFRHHLREEGVDIKWNLVHSILRKSLFEHLEKDTSIAIYQNLAKHLIQLPAGDALRITETMYHLIMSETVNHAIDYYISELNEEEKVGATKVLAETIGSWKNGTEWVVSMIRATKKDDNRAWKLANLFIYYLDDALSVEGSLLARQKILEMLKARLEKSGKAFIADPHYSHDYGALLQKLGSIHQLMGNIVKALMFFEERLKLFKELLKSDPLNESLLNNLAISYAHLGDINQVWGDIRETLFNFEWYNLLSKELYESDPQNESLKKSLAISYAYIGDINQTMGKIEDALKYFKEYNSLSKELYESNPQNEFLKYNLASSYYKMGGIHMVMGHMEKALKNFKKHYILSRDRYESYPQNVFLKNSLAISYAHLGDIHQSMGRMEEALKCFEKFIQLSYKLYESNPQNEMLKYNLASSYSRMGVIHNVMGHMEDTLKYFKEYNSLSQELYESNPQNDSIKKSLAISYSHLGDVNQAMGRMEEALNYFKRRAELVKDLYETYPESRLNESIMNSLAISYEKLGDIHQAMGSMEEALNCFVKFIQINNGLSKSNPQNESLKYNYASSCYKIGRICMVTGRIKEAMIQYEEDYFLSKELYEANPLNVFLKNSLAISYSNLGDIHQSMGNMKEALKYFIKRLELGKELYESNPQIELIKKGHAISFERLGFIHQAMGNMEEALNYFENYNQLSKKFYNSNPQSISLLEGLGISYYKLAMVFKATGNDHKGKEYLVQWKHIISHLAKNLPQVAKYRQWDQLEY